MFYKTLCTFLPFLLYQIHKNKNNHHRDEEVNYFIFIHILPFLILCSNLLNRYWLSSNSDLNSCPEMPYGNSDKTWCIFFPFLTKKIRYPIRHIKIKHINPNRDTYWHQANTPKHYPTAKHPRHICPVKTSQRNMENKN